MHGIDMYYLVFWVCVMGAQIAVLFLINSYNLDSPPSSGFQNLALGGWTIDESVWGVSPTI